jgi:hypothetical protein
MLCLCIYLVVFSRDREFPFPVMTSSHSTQPILSPGRMYTTNCPDPSKPRMQTIIPRVYILLRRFIGPSTGTVLPPWIFGRSV